MSLVLQNSYGKSHLVHFVDTPGHVNFVDEVASAVRLVDGVLLVVDVVEGVRLYALLSCHKLINLFSRLCATQKRSFDIACKRGSR